MSVQSRPLHRLNSEHIYAKIIMHFFIDRRYKVVIKMIVRGFVLYE